MNSIDLILEDAERNFQSCRILDPIFRGHINTHANSDPFQRMKAFNYDDALDVMVEIIKDVAPSGVLPLSKHCSNGRLVISGDSAFVVGLIYEFSFAYVIVAWNQGVSRKTVYEDLFVSLYTGKLSPFTAESAGRI